MSIHKGIAAVRRARCPTCDSKNTLYRKGDRLYWCRKCGQHFKVMPTGKIRKVKT